jgi:hypothetical protein
MWNWLVDEDGSHDSGDVVVVAAAAAVVVVIVVEVVCLLVDYSLEAINRFGTNKGSGTNICCSGLLVYVTVHRLYSS